MTPGEVRRLYFIIRTFLSYGLDELIPKMRITLPLRLWRYTLFWMPNRHKDKPLGETAETGFTGARPGVD
ncbi:putative ubiquinone biosynthesis protein UbiB [Citrobacter braakii]|nr:putative ubiquinone biosynthesis protein UbiB [Citrobacter braakii]